MSLLCSLSISCLASRMTAALDLSMILCVNLCCSSDLISDLWPSVVARGLGLREAVSRLMVRGSSTGLSWSGITRVRGLLRLSGSEDEDRNRESEDTLLRSGDFLGPLFRLFRLSPAAFLCLSLDKDNLLEDRDNFFDQDRTFMLLWWCNKCDWWDGGNFRIFISTSELCYWWTGWCLLCDWLVTS